MMGRDNGGNGGRRLPRWIWAVLVAVVAIGVYLVRPAARDGSPADGPEIAAEAAVALPRLVDLGADRCVPCKLMAPILVELASEYEGRFEVTFIDVWKDPQAGVPYGIKLIPTQIFLAADGSELFRHEGFFAKDDILAKWRELGVEL